MFFGITFADWRDCSITFVNAEPDGALKDDELPMFITDVPHTYASVSSPLFLANCVVDKKIAQQASDLRKPSARSSRQ